MIAFETWHLEKAHEVTEYVIDELFGHEQLVEVEHVVAHGLQHLVLIVGNR